MIKACPHCPNRSDQGSFIGDLCAPCHNKRKKEDRVEVYDYGNPDRLLGTVNKPAMQHKFVQVAVLPRVSISSYYEPSYPEMSVHTITLEASIKRGPHPLDVRGVLATTAKLRDLLNLRDFRLPGESEMEASYRKSCY